MEAWRSTWRRGIAPLLPKENFSGLLELLKSDSRKLIQGDTTRPPPLQSVSDWPVEAGDLIVCAFWTDENWTVSEAEEAFARVCFECDQILGECAGCRHFLNWWDNSPRYEVISAMIPEVELCDRLLYGPEIPAGIALACAQYEPYAILAFADWLEEQGIESSFRCLAKLELVTNENENAIGNK